MRPRAEGLISRLAAAVGPARPWLHVNASPRVARFLVAAGARPGCMGLEAALLSGAGLPGTDPRRAYPRDAGPAGMRQSRADLTGAQLAEADLRGADLTEATLTRALLRDADLSRADLRAANLTEATLTRADLRGADLRGADLRGADLADVLWSSETLWPGDMGSLMRARSEELRPGVWQAAGPGTSGEAASPVREHRQGAGSPEEAQLVAQIAGGNMEEPMKELYRRYAKNLYRFGLHMLGDDELAGEMVQEAFQRLWRSAGRYDAGRGSVGAFLFVIARSAAADIRNRPSSRPLPAAEDGKSPPLPDDAGQLLGSLTLREALEELSSAHAEVLRLVMEEGLTQAEIAERLGLAAGTVKTRISNGMRALRVALAEPGSTRSRGTPDLTTAEIYEER